MKRKENEIIESDKKTFPVLFFPSCVFVLCTHIPYGTHIYMALYVLCSDLSCVLCMACAFHILCTTYVAYRVNCTFNVHSIRLAKRFEETIEKQDCHSSKLNKRAGYEIFTWVV